MKRTLFRLAVTLLFLLVPVLGTWTFVIADDHGWWFPENVSTYGGSIDRLFYQILVMVTITFLLTEGILVWCIFWYGRENKAKAWFTHGIHKLELFWTAIPAVLLLVIFVWHRVRPALAADTHIEVPDYLDPRRKIKVPRAELHEPLDDQFYALHLGRVTFVVKIYWRHVHF